MVGRVRCSAVSERGVSCGREVGGPETRTSRETDYPGRVGFPRGHVGRGLRMGIRVSEWVEGSEIGVGDKGGGPWRVSDLYGSQAMGCGEPDWGEVRGSRVE